MVGEWRGMNLSDCDFDEIVAGIFVSDPMPIGRLEGGGGEGPRASLSTRIFPH